MVLQQDPFNTILKDGIIRLKGRGHRLTTHLNYFEGSAEETMQLCIGIVRNVQFGSDVEKQHLEKMRIFLTNTIWSKAENDANATWIELYIFY